MSLRIMMMMNRMIIWISHLLHIGSGPSRCHLAEATTDQPWERKVENQAMLLWARWKTGLVKDKRSKCWWLPWSKLWSLVLSRGPNIFLLLRGGEPSLTAHSSFFLVSQPPRQQKPFYSFTFWRLILHSFWFLHLLINILITSIFLINILITNLMIIRCHTHPTRRGDWDYCSPYPRDQVRCHFHSKHQNLGLGKG